MNSQLASSGSRRLSTLRRPILPFTIIPSQRRLAHGSYGGGEGDPKGEAPQDQGSNPSAEKEHPGPPPPAEGRGSGGGPTKGAGSGENSKNNASKNDNGRQGGTTKGAAQPKILNEGLPTELSDEVKQHNEEMTHRHDRAGAQVGDSKNGKVSKGFWSGKIIAPPAQVLESKQIDVST